MAPTGIVLMLLIPLLLSGIIGLAFGTGDGEQKFPTLKLLVWNRDEGLVGRLFASTLGQESASQYVDAEFVAEEGMERIRQGKASALLILPEGLTDSILAGGTATLELIKNPAEQYMPLIAENGMRLVASALDALVRILEPELALIRNADEVDAHIPEQEQIASISAAMSGRFYRLAQWFSPWPVKLEMHEPDESSSEGMNVFGYVLPGLTVMMLLMIAQKLLREISEEHENGTLSAVLATPIDVTEYAMGKALGLLILTLAGFAVLLPCGSLLFSIHWGEPVAVLTMAIGFSLAASGMMMLLCGITRSSRQAEAVGITVVLLMSLVGGSMVPFRAEHGVLAVLSRLTPNRWAIDGFLAVMQGEPVTAILGEAGVLFVAGLVMLVTGAMLFRKRVMQ